MFLLIVISVKAYVIYKGVISLAQHQQCCAISTKINYYIKEFCVGR